MSTWVGGPIGEFRAESASAEPAGGVGAARRRAFLRGVAGAGLVGTGGLRLLTPPGSAAAMAGTPAHLTEQVAKLLARDGEAVDEFGWSVSVDGDTALVGAFAKDHHGVNSGAAYVFGRSGDRWVQQAKLTPSEGADGDNFGWAVAVSGGTALVGARYDNEAGTNAGAVYVFTGGGSAWTETAKLTASDSQWFDNFGWAVALDGETALVGAKGDDDDGSSSGAAYVFTGGGGGWTETAKLTATDAEAVDNFGWSVAVSGRTALVGAPSEDQRGTNAGAAYVFTGGGGGWSQQAKLTAGDADPGDSFGFAVSLDGETALVGAHLDDEGGINAGAAYVFERTGGGWTQQAKLTASDADGNDAFGRAVSVAGDVALVGAPANDENGVSAGAAYLFTREEREWTEHGKLLAEDGGVGDEFGWAVSVDGATALVGAPLKDENEANTGAAYVFGSAGDRQATG